MLYNFVSDHVVSSPLRDFANEARFAASPIDSIGRMLMGRFVQRGFVFSPQA